MCTSLSYDYINGYLYVNSNGNPLIEPLGHIIIESPFEIATEIPIETNEKWNQVLIMMMNLLFLKIW